AITPDSNHTILNEILTGHWLLSHSGLLQMGHFFKSLSENAQEAPKNIDRSAQILSFFGDDNERIHPSSVSEIPEGSIAVVNIVGPMMKYGNWWMLGANEVVAQLDFVNNLKNVAAIMLYVDGPG